VTVLAAASDQSLAAKAANQMNYNNVGHSFSGYAGTGWSTASGVKYTKANLTTFTPSLFVVSGVEPTQKVTFVKENGEAQPAEEANGLQAGFEAVPMPDVTKVAGAKLTADTGDSEICIVRPSTGEMWEMWKFFGTSGAYTFRYGAYLPNFRASNGVLPNNWGARATSLALIGGLITMQDLVDILMGGSIGHALAVAMPATGPGWVGPATRSDKGAGQYDTFLPELHEGAANPAYPYVDAVPEGSWFRFPPGSRAGEHGLTKYLEVAVYEAIRRHGMFVADAGSENPHFYIETPLSIGSAYSWARVNPIAGAPFVFNAGLGYMPASWTDSKLPTFAETINGEGNCFAVQPWQLLERLEPFTA
jgi:hypothetical protein